MMVSKNNMMSFGRSRKSNDVGCCCLWMVLLLPSFISSPSFCLASTEKERELQQLPPQAYTLPYAIGFYFVNESLPETTCRAELDNVTAAVYPAYELDIMINSIMTLDFINRLKQYANSSAYSTRYNTTTNNTIHKYKKRQLRHGSRQNSLLSSSDDEERQQQVEYHRRLQSWCYSQCTQKPRDWLKLNGCGPECGLRRRKLIHDNDAYHRNVVELSSLTKVLSMVNDDYYTRIGTSTSLLAGQGYLSASTFYRKVREMIPTSNPCCNLLLTMTYKRIPLVINIP